MRKIGLLLLVIISLLSCKKKKAHFLIKGTITDNSFSAPLTGATAYLYSVPTGTNKQVFLATSDLAADGTYNFDILRDKSDEYVIKIDKENYFSLEKTINFSALSVEKDNIYNYSIDAKSWVNLHFKNLSPQASDELQYIKQQGKADCLECCPKSYQFLTGAVDTNIYCINNGNSIYSYMYFVSGTSNNGIKEMMTIPFDTVELYLEY
ncbi:MAG: hypothetical protein HYR91_07050 [Flavobacteriia bacterium]|nr:hypothetical protein [Flavobacteriia bacterium]